jgi:hypothetical protein
LLCKCTGGTKISISFQWENFNAPRGPDEVSEVWRAQSRISYSVLTVLVWSDLIPWPGMSFTFITPTDFVECFNEAAAERIAPGLQEHFIDYLPSMTRQDFKQQCPLIQRRSLPSIMTAIHRHSQKDLPIENMT